MSSRLIVEEIKKVGGANQAPPETPTSTSPFSDFGAVKSALEQVVRSNDVLIVMERGYCLVARDLCKIIQIGLTSDAIDAFLFLVI